MKKLIVSVVAILALSGVASDSIAARRRNCNELRQNLTASIAHAKYAASWHYLSTATQRGDWKHERKLRAKLRRELKRCGRR